MQIRPNQSSSISRLESICVPRPVFLATELNPVVKSAPTALPKLNFVRDQPVSTPELRSLDYLLTFEALYCLVIFLFQISLGGNRSALIRSPSTNFRVARPFLEIFVGLFFRDSLNSAFYSYLLFERTPPEGHRSKWVRANVIGLT